MGKNVHQTNNYYNECFNEFKFLMKNWLNKLKCMHINVI